MARFYKTTNPDFVDDFMYTPPWELAGKVMEANEQGIQQTIASTQMFQDFDIQHINDPVLKEQAEGIKNKYASSADEIAKSLQTQLASNPQAWRSQLPKIGKLAQELQKDVRSGDIFKMMSDSQRQQAWIENNKDANPELLNAAYNEITRRFQADPERKEEWSAAGLDNISKFDINNKEIIEQLRKFELQTEDSFSPDESLIIKRKFRDKDALVQNYMSLVLADPEAQRYLQQATALKLPGFVDKEGNPIPWEVPVNIKTREKISQEEYNKELKLFLGNELSEDEKVIQGRDTFKYAKVPNQEFAWTRNFMGMADVIGGEVSREFRANPLYTQKMNRQHQRNLADIRGQNNRNNGDNLSPDEVIEQLENDQDRAASIGDIDAATRQAQQFAPSSNSQSTTSQTPVTEATVPEGNISTSSVEEDTDMTEQEEADMVFEQQRGGPNATGYAAASSSKSSTPKRTEYVTKNVEEPKKEHVKPIKSQQEYLDMMNKYVKLQDANIRRLESNADNMQYAGVQRILQNERGANTYNYQRTRTLDLTVNKLVYQKLNLDQGERMPEEDQFAVEIHELLNDDISSYSGVMLETQVKEFIKNKYDKPEEYFEKTRTYKRPMPSGAWEEVEEVIKTPAFKKILGSLNNIVDSKKKAYSEYSRVAQDDAIVNISESKANELRQLVTDAPDSYRFIPVNRAEYDGVKYMAYKDGGKKEKIHIPTAADINRKKGKEFEYQINSVSPHTPYGIAAIVQRTVGDSTEKFFMVSTKSMVETTNGYNLLFRETNSKKNRIYDNDAERDYMHHHIDNHFYSMIINHTAMFKQLYDSGMFEEDPDIIAFKTDALGNVEEENGQPVYMKDEEGNPVASKYHDIKIPTGVGDVYTIRQYYDSGRSNPYVLYENGVRQDTFADIISLSWAINARNTDRTMEKKAEKEAREAGQTRKIYEL